MKLLNCNVNDRKLYQRFNQKQSNRFWNYIDSELELLMANQTTHDVYCLITKKLKVIVRTKVIQHCYLPIATGINKAIFHENY